MSSHAGPGTYQPDNSKAVQKWADVAMFTAKAIDVAKGPSVQLLSCNNDPLGAIASVAKIYKGESVPSLAYITDDERRFYLADVRKNVLAAPLEFVNFHFLISGVTRGFTHQMVRQRTATYGQESMRFAVKETMPVGYPPSLNGTVAWKDWLNQCWQELYPVESVTGKAMVDEMRLEQVTEYATKRATPQQLWRKEWDSCVANISNTYNGLVNGGMPAEDARGLAPTNVLTTINYNTSLRGLLDHAGLRLCTQAQFEWRVVWARMLEAIREYGASQVYTHTMTDSTGGYDTQSSMWQFEELATIFKPICYQKGSCQFMSDLDRSCTIRERVNANAKVARPSVEWDNEFDRSGDMLNVEGYGPRGGNGVAYRKSDDAPVYIGPIQDSEWMLDEKAARVSQ